MKKLPLCALLIAAGTLAHGEDELEISAEEFPRIPAVEPADVNETFEIAPGFRLFLAAHEPEVADPIAMTFDEKGRAYVVEMRGYSERREEALGRIRLLTDTNGDGIFDQSTIFKDGLKWPTAVICYQGGVFVGATPDLLYFRDNDGDGICDDERTVFTGFGEGNLKLNMQALFNSFRWGPDNRIWGATARNGGTVTRPDSPSFEPVAIRGADFSFDPEALDFRAENGTAQYGMSFDSEGRRFVCSNSNHLVWVAYERGQVHPNPWYSPPPALVSIADDGAAAPVYRISPDEPWRIVRTRWRVAGVVKGVVEGGGRVSGYFTSATGVHLYWGTAFGKEFRNNAFIGDVGSNLVHRKLVRTADDSVGLVGTRPDPGETTEFLRSRDNWFRPTSFTTGPDGCLYITDMYREVIEHPWSLPEPIKKHLDLNSGFERGRIYRVEPVDFQRVPSPDLSAATEEELLALVDHENDWHATTARRLLYERGQPASPRTAVSPFPALLASESPLLDRVEEATSDRWIRVALLNSLRTPDALSAAWSKVSALGTAGNDLASELLVLIGRSGEQELIAAVADDLSARPMSRDLSRKISALLEGAGYGGRDTGKLVTGDRWAPLLASASEALSDSSRSVADRETAVSLLRRLGGAKAQDTFVEVLAADPADPVAPKLVSAIRNLEYLVSRFSQLPSTSHAELGNRILGNAKASEKFLQRIEDSSIDLSIAPASLIEGLRQHKSAKIQRLAESVLPPISSRLDVIAVYRRALSLEGDRDRGKAAFTKACIACHVAHDGTGIQLGPPIASFASAGGDSLLERILDPNREVAPQYQTYVFEIENGTTLTGIIHEETPEEVTVRMPGGIDQTFPRKQVKSMKGLGQSLMPEGLETTLSVQEMADLLAYLAAPSE